MTFYGQPHPAWWSAGTWPQPLYYDMYGHTPWTYPNQLYYPPYMPEHHTSPAPPAKRIGSRPHRHEVIPRKSAPKADPQLHRLLGGLRRPTCIWDVGYPPSSAYRRTSRGTDEPLLPSILKQPAAQPAIKHMRILSEAFPWVVFVPDNPRGGTTVKSVLEAIYNLLHEPLDPEDWEERCDASKRKIYKVMFRRLMMAPPAMEAAGQVLKIDSLLNKTTFLGLRPAGANTQEWFLSLGPGRNP